MANTDRNLRSKNVSGLPKPTGQTPIVPSTLTQRTPSYSNPRSRGRGGTRGSSRTHGIATDPPKNPRKDNTQKSPQKTLNPIKPIVDPAAKAKTLEGQSVNDILNAQLANNGASSMQDLLGFGGNQEPPVLTTNVQEGTESERTLRDELIRCKMQIQAMSSQISQLKVSNVAAPAHPNAKASASTLNNVSNEDQIRVAPKPGVNPLGPRLNEVEYEEPLDDDRESEASRSSSSEEEVPQLPNRRRFRRCEMDKWRIKFSGGNGIKFLKKVEKLQRAYEYDDDTVYKHFYLLLDGHALEWYWQYSDQYDPSNLAHLKREIKRVFKPRETDMMLVSAMYSRKQNQDTFEKFYNEVVDMNFTLKDPLSDQQLIEILRTNMEDEIRQRIFTYETTDRIKFFHKANQAYHDACKNKERRKPMQEYRPQRKAIHEVDFEEMSNYEIEEISAKLDKWKKQRAERTCFNCHLAGHLLADCPEEVSRFFCFKCGMEGTVTPKCPRCSPKANRGVE